MNASGMKVISRLLGVSLILYSGKGIWALAAMPQPIQISQAGALQAQWKVFKAPGVELSLPENFVGGSPRTTSLPLLMAQFQELGSQFESIADAIERNPNAYLLIAVDPKTDSSGGVTNVVVATEQISTTATLDSYLDFVVKRLPAPIKVVDRKLVKIGKNQAGRLVTEANWEKGTLKQLLYVIKQGRSIWTIAYSTGEQEYEWRLPTFEQSIARFKTLSPAPQRSRKK